ncbi:MAG: hypothetical protein CSA22_09295 [Deltaproteobacteria bacterium]|nr:MAG: hypothetical protein CSA22_09295 [Deltaproteobacteria bacterium]
MKSASANRRVDFRILWLTVLSGVFAVSVLLPVEMFQHGTWIETERTVCIFKSLTGIPCPFCGMTRAFVFAGRLRIADAFFHNPAGLLLYGYMVIYIVAGWGEVLFRKDHFRPFLDYNALTPMLRVILFSWLLMLTCHAVYG